MAWLALGPLTRELRDGEVVVGGGADADWRVTTADLMPRHFILIVHGLNTSVRPGSADVVVVVNGKQLTGSSALLNEGDVIAAGAGTFVYSEDPPVVTPADPPPRPRAFLVDVQENVAHELVNRSTPLGRDASNAIVLRDPTASRFHAEVRREAGGFALHTMGSAGTVVNGQPLKGPCLLSEGDTLEIAHVRLRFTRQQPPAGTPQAAAHGSENDAAGRRPTVMSDRFDVKPDTVSPPSGRRIQPAVWVALLVALAAIIAWILFRARA